MAAHSTTQRDRQWLPESRLGRAHVTVNLLFSLLLVAAYLEAIS